MFTDPKNLLTYHTNDRKVRLNGTPVHVVPIRAPIEFNSREHGERRIVSVVGAMPLPGTDTLLARVLHGEANVVDALQLIGRYRGALDGDFSRTMLTYVFDEADKCYALMYDHDDAHQRRSPYHLMLQDDDMVLGSLNPSLTTLCNDLLVTATSAEAGLQALIRIATHRYSERGEALLKKIENGISRLADGNDEIGMYSLICESINEAWPVKSAIDNTIPRYMLAATFANLHEKFNHVD